MSKQDVTVIDAQTTDIVHLDNLGGEVPSFLVPTSGQGSGLEGLKASDFVIPRIKLLQGQSTEVKDKLPGAEEGVFWLNVLDKPLGQSLRFTVIKNRVRVLLSAPLDDGQGILARADDGVTWDKTGEWNVKIKNIRNPVKWAITDRDVDKSGLLNFGTSVPEDPQSNPAATRFYDYLVYLHDFDMIAVISLARSAAKKAKDLNGKIDLAKIDMNGLVLKAAVITDPGNGSGSFSNYRFELDGYVQDQAIYSQIKQYAKQYKTFRVADELDEDGARAAPANGPANSDAY